MNTRRQFLITAPVSALVVVACRGDRQTGAGATPAPTEAAVALDDIPGQSAADQTCSAGNVRANG